MHRKLWTASKKDRACDGKERLSQCVHIFCACTKHTQCTCWANRALVPWQLCRTYLEMHGSFTRSLHEINTISAAIAQIIQSVWCSQYKVVFYPGVVEPYCHFSMIFFLTHTVVSIDVLRISSTKDIHANVHKHDSCAWLALPKLCTAALHQRIPNRDERVSPKSACRFHHALL